MKDISQYDVFWMIWEEVIKAYSLTKEIDEIVKGK